MYKNAPKLYTSNIVKIFLWAIFSAANIAAPFPVQYTNTFCYFLPLFAPILNGLTGIALQLQHRFIDETLPVASIGKEVLTSSSAADAIRFALYCRI
jgi:hypothetical protein